MRTDLHKKSHAQATLHSFPFYSPTRRWHYLGRKPARSHARSEPQKKGKINDKGSRHCQSRPLNTEGSGSDPLRCSLARCRCLLSESVLPFCFHGFFLSFFLSSSVVEFELSAENPTLLSLAVSDYWKSFHVFAGSAESSSLTSHIFLDPLSAPVGVVGCRTVVCRLEFRRCPGTDCKAYVFVSLWHVG